MGTLDWNALDHLIQNIRENVSVEYIHGGIFIKAHKIFKETFSMSSKRVNSVMRQAVPRKEEKVLKDNVYITHL